MSEIPVRTPKMARANNIDSSDVVLNIGLDEGSGDVFSDLVSGGTFTDNTGTVDHTTTPHAPEVDYTGAITGAPTPLFSVSPSQTLIVFHGTLVNTGGVFSTWNIGGAISNTERLTAANAGIVLGTVNSNIGLTRTTLSPGQTAFVAVKWNLATNVIKIYEAVNFATPALIDTDTLAPVGAWEPANWIKLGNSSAPQATYGLLAYAKDADVSDADMINYLDRFQNSWGNGQKILIPGL